MTTTTTTPAATAGSRRPAVNGERRLSASAQLHCPDPQRIRTSESALLAVAQKLRQFGRGSVSEEERRALRQTSFSNWEFADDRLLLFLRQMFVDLTFTEKFDIDLDTLEAFLLEVYSHYNQVPFHNFSHCFMVAQMAYALTWINELWQHYTHLELLSLLLAAICHDLDHPGLSNYYQRSAGTTLAARYENDSPLENHHLATTFRILADPRCNVLKNVSAKEFLVARQAIVRLILATDMSRHQEIVEDFESIAGDFDFDSAAHRELLMRILIKTSDISNEARPFKAADRWIDCLLTEFFEEAQLEKSVGIKPLPNMDPDLVRKPESQCQFIRNVALPMSQILATIFPQMRRHFVEPIQKQLEHYSVLTTTAPESPE